ncbi:MAG: sialate O-acetylesterase, partial [Planctomycetota bacterium]
MNPLEHRFPRQIMHVVVGCLALAAAANAGGESDGREPLRVFLLAGQSNAEGADTNAAQIDSYPPFVGAGSPQPDVRYWYETDSAPLTSGGWIALQPELQRNILGPELTFGLTVKSAIDAPIAIIKSTRGGTNLAVDWDPDNPAGAQMYARTMSLLETALASLDDEGIAWEFGGVLWQQGENDMLNSTHVAQYGARLTALIERVRSDLGAPDLPWFIGATSDKCIWGMDFRDNMQILRSQQLAAVAADPLAHFVPASHLAFAINLGQLQPHYHFGTEGQLQLGVAHADAYLESIGLDTPHQSEPFCCGDPTDAGDDVRVFIFAGQRSMEGDGAHVAHIGDYPAFADLDEPQQDVLYRYRLGGGLHTSTDWAPLGPADYLGNFGPELSFGRIVSDGSSDPIAVIKVTHSAAVMRDWLPNPSDASLPQYDEAIAFIQSALADLESRGRTPVLEAVIWTPGEHDAWWTPFR